MIAKQVERLIAERGTNPRAVSIASGMSPTGVRDIISRKTKNPTYSSLVRIANTLGVDVLELVGRTRPASVAVSVAGHVGAGAIVELADAHAKGDGLYHISCPPQVSPHGIVGVEVRGDSMAPIYQPGDVLLYTRDALGVPSEAIGKICICEDEDGRAWVKVVRTGSQEGTFSLISVNPESAHMHGIRLKWAAPVRLHLPAEFVTKVG